MPSLPPRSWPLPEANPEYQNPDLAQKWDVLLAVRGEVQIEVAVVVVVTGVDPHRRVTVDVGNKLVTELLQQEGKRWEEVY